MHDRIRGRGQRYLNFLLIQTVRNFPLAKGVRIIEVRLYRYHFKVTVMSRLLTLLTALCKLICKSLVLANRII
jgi:hypothetical protein